VSALLGHLMATLFDGVVEIVAYGGVSYLVFQHGMPLRGYYADEANGDTTSRTRSLVERAFQTGGSVRRWPVPPALPNQAAPALITAYRELVGTLMRRLTESGAHGAFAVAEHARHHLVARHPALDRFSLTLPNQRDPVVETPALSLAIAAWLKETMWHLHLPDGVRVEALMAEVARSRRHLFQAAGLWEALGWEIPW
jgi:hypothetical protein